MANGVLRSITIDLNECRKSFSIGDFHGSFTKTSDLARIWTQDRLRSVCVDDSPNDAARRSLSTSQLEQLRRNALPFLSFAVVIGVRPSWFLHDLPRIAFLDDNCSRLALPQSKANLEHLLDKPLRPHEFDEQYRFAPPIALELTTDSGNPVEIPEKHTLPMETPSDSPKYEAGSYGKVYFARLDPEYVQAYPYDRQQAFRPTQPYAVAVKVFNRDEEANLEIRNLTDLKKIASSPDCRHSISLHHVIAHFFADSSSDSPKPLVIFPFAALGNLWQFLNGQSAVGDLDGRFTPLTLEERFPLLRNLPSNTGGRFSDLAEPLLEQCLALAEALRFLHGRIQHGGTVYWLAHMDLKPNNIIISKHPHHDLGIWKLADFGISVVRRHSPQTFRESEVGDASHGPRAPLTIDTSPKRGSSTYQAPEIWLSSRSQPHEEQYVRVGRMSDIWSFGAILAEVLAFAVGGTHAFSEFQKQRLGYSGDHPPVRNDCFWEWKPALPLASPQASRWGDFRQVQQPSPRLGPTASKETYANAQVRPGVHRWLEAVKTNNPACAAWVDCIMKTLKVNPQERLSAEILFLEIQKVLYPPQSHSSNETDAELTTTMDHHEISAYSRPWPVQERAHGYQGHAGAPLTRRPGDTSPPRRSSTIPVLPGAGYGTATLFSVPRLIQSNPPGPSWDPQPDQRRPDPGPGDNSIRSNTSISSSVPSDRSTVRSFATAGVPARTKHELVTGATSVSVDRDRVVYLTKHKIFVLDIQPGAVQASTNGPSTGMITSSHHYELPPDVSSNKWKGVRVGGNYVVLYGHQKPRGSLIHIRKLQKDSNGSHTSGSSWVPLGNDVAQAVATFNYDKRVAVSPHGLVAMIAGSGRELLVLDASNDTTVSNLTTKRLTNEAMRFQDVSFDEDGAFMYAFISEVGSPSTLLAYSTQQPDMRRVAKATHKINDLSVKEFDDGTQVFPYSGSLGCTVATKALTRLLTCPLSSEWSGLDGEMRPLGRNSSFEPRLRAITMHGSRLLLTVDKDGHFAEYTLTGTPTGQLGTPKVIFPFDKSPKPDCQLRAYLYSEAGCALVLLCHVGGKVEVARFPVRAE